MSCSQRPDPDRATRRRRSLGLGLGVLLVALGAWIALLTDGQLGWGGDAAMYLMQARNLVEGVPNNATGYIQNPHAYLAPQVYPIGFPLLLAPAYALFGLNIYLLKLYAGLIYLGAIGVFAWLVRRDLGGPDRRAGWWLLVVAAVGFQPFIQMKAVSLYAGGAFLLLVYATLALVDHYMTRTARGESAMRIAAMAGLLLGFSAQTRIFGLVLFVAVPLAELMRDRRVSRSGLVCLATAAMCYLAFHAFVAWDSVAITAGSHAGYGHLLADGPWAHAARLPAVVVDSLHQYVYLARHFLVMQWPWQSIPQHITNTMLALTCVAIVIGLIGFVMQIQRRLAAREVFAVFYLASLLPWTARDARYLMPIVPLWFFYIGLVADRLTRGGTKRRAVALAAVSVLVALLYVAGYGNRFTNARLPPGSTANDASAQAVYDYLRRHTAPDAVVLFYKPRVVSLFARRPALTYTDTENPTPPDAQLDALISDNHVRYILRNRQIRDGLGAYLARRPKRIDVVYRNPGFVLYRVAAARVDR